MEKWMNNIKNDIDLLFNEIEGSDLYKNYLSVKAQLIKNNEIMELIGEIKRYQKILVNSKDKVIEKEIIILYDKLNSFPLYQSYLYILEELNNELSGIKNIFENYFKSILKIK